MEEKTRYMFKCMLCGTPIMIMAYPSDMERYQKGEGLIQDIFPYLTADEREIIMTGICGKCFDSAFDDDEEW